MLESLATTHKTIWRGQVEVRELNREGLMRGGAAGEKGVRTR